MAEDLNEQEPTAEEKEKFEADVLKAAEDAMMLPPSSPQTLPLNSLPKLPQKSTRPKP